MMKIVIFFGFSLCMLHTVAAKGFSVASDSIGVETVNGKMFVLHRVEEKETLFAISRRYRTTVDAIIEYNKEAANGLEIGQVLRVPYTPKSTAKQVEGTVHEVQAGETMFSIAKKYGVSVDDVKNWNNLTTTSLSVGQSLVIRKKGATSATANNTTPPSTQMMKKGAHTVAAQETLYSIARQYGVTTQQLTDLNGLTSNELKVGQVLMVAQPEKSTAVTTKKNEPAPANTSPVNNEQRNTTASNANTSRPKDPEPTKSQPEPAKTQTEPVKTQPEPPTTQTIKISESVRNGSEVVEGGIAELIEGTEGNRKYLALHRTAPVGTILKVRNEINNREVFVRVMGKLPDTALTDKVIIRLSKSAYDRLGAIDQRFRVEVTYYK